MALWALLVGLVGGIAAALQAPFTGLMGQRVGELGSVFITYCGGAFVILLIFLASGPSFTGWRSLPWYVALAGPLGLLIIASLSFTVPRLGAVTATALFILASLCFSALIDHYGWFGVSQKVLDPGRLFGVLALIIGTWLVSR